MIDRIAIAAALLLPLMGFGCGGPGSDNRSTRADEDPAAYDRAKAQDEQADQQARAAEAAAVGDAFEGIERP